MSLTSDPIQQFAIPTAAYGTRLDKFLVIHFPHHSRSKINQWIEKGRVQIDQVPIQKSGYLLKASDRALSVDPEPEGEKVNWGPQAGDLAVVFEDDHFLVVNKPPNLVVHPSEGTKDRSLVNFLHNRDPALNALPRCGLIHRLDKGTSGLLVVAKNLPAYQTLVEALKRREIEREYVALVWGEPNAFGVIDKPMGRHPVFRKKMAILSVTGKSAQTHFYKLAQFKGLAYLRVRLQTGRTHQIRVHLSDLGFPLLGDKLYGGRKVYCKEPSNQSVEWDFPALHARRLRFAHPISGIMQEFQVDPPEKFQKTLHLCSAPEICEASGL